MNLFYTKKEHPFMDALKSYHLKNSDLTARKKIAVSLIFFILIQIYAIAISS